ncbi:Putative Type IIG restriction enzyme [Synechococcus sp. RS9909]|uniref:Eco57I restriction-modification methylase domain-containing protein n=1 Tax=unclassified Synechococcus TaxID=2626047 RepID=UPI0000690943|nr:MULTISPECIES: N-6 DNA methylase [unclassified Synechococcus]EAQ68740.1 putative restriction enzyme [Synechococcus sp. RS9917]QNI78348.1 Putative Type IIG restriction enzyme [Synechococcus sp. RS9909]
MPALASDLRKALEATVVDARDKAERGARDALTALAVGASEPFSSMSDEERKLRNRLRARGRQLGDQRDAQKGTQSIERLVREMAYEHWHRMLFARFLAENQLLIEPSSGVSITLNECEELAAEEGTDLWGMAAQFAQGMLPQIFRTDDPVLALSLPLEIRQQLQALVAGLDAEVFTASDSLGWTYQFWQTKRKKEVNDSGVKIGADELSPVTQLFTEDYMVDFLLDNTLGAWHAGKILAANPELASKAQTEDELRQAVALPGCPWNYLRLIKSDDGVWAPAAGTFEGWPRAAADLKCLDPCMGSGHFVVAMFERLVALRLAEGDQMEAAAMAAVIKSNLFGLEIDPRCTQIAAFNLALAAWRRVGHCKLPAMNLACSGLAPNTRKADWIAIAGNNERLTNGMERLYWLFQKASVLGSLINPRAAEGDLLVADFHELQPLLEQALAQESQDDNAHEIAVTARGLTKAAEMLAGHFTLVATNVPYLGRGKHSEAIKEYCDRAHPEAKADLATCFAERCLHLCSIGGCSALVTPQNWWFSGTYSKFRASILQEFSFSCVAALGEEAWQSFGDRGPAAALMVVQKRKPDNDQEIIGINALPRKTISEKAREMASGEFCCLSQRDQQKNPDHRITIEKIIDGVLLQNYAESPNGSHGGDAFRHRRAFWEFPWINENWRFFQGTVDKTQYYGGRESVFSWFADGREHKENPSAYIKGEHVAGKMGVAISMMRELPTTLYSGELFDISCTPIVPKSPGDLTAIWAFCSSPEYCTAVRKIDQKVKVTNATLTKIPFDLAHWQRVAAEKYPQGLPKPFSSDSTQWLFDGNPAGASQPLHVVIPRLVGYQWPRQTGSSFPDCPALASDGLEALADGDGIVCLSPIRGEAAAADRLRGLLAAAFGDEWSNSKERELLLETAVANDTKKAAADLSEWLRQSFFTEHCKLFQSRPFVWQIWDGNPHGFSALVNYHKLAAPNGQGRKTLELLAYTYLGDWIDRQKLDQAEGVNGADDRLAAALDLQGQLKKILEGEPPYDIFVRWKPLHQQSIGWDPDINDGVRLNIRPFLNAQLRKGGKAGAGILRAKPGTIKWKKDRGKEPIRSKDDFPWFWGWDENNTSLAIDYGAPISEAPAAGDSFDGNRWNDLHYTRAAKEAARARHRGEA